MEAVRKNRKDRNRNDTTRTAFSLLCAFVTGVGMALAWAVFSLLLQPQKLFPDTVVTELFSLPVSAQIVFSAVVSPVLEEYLFRFFLFRLVSRAVGDRAATLLVSALFALWHGNGFQMLYAFPAGLILQNLRNRSGRMGEPVLCHIGANLTAILVHAVYGSV